MNKEQFLRNFKEALEMESNGIIVMKHPFRELEEWDSLSQLSLIAMLDEEYEVELDSEALETLRTVEDLYFFIKSKL